MAQFKPCRITAAQLDKLAIEDGQLIFLTDTKQIYIDVDSKRLSILPEAVSELTNDTGFLTKHQDISGKANTKDLAKVATSGSYNDLIGKPIIPTVNNATLTIQKNGTNVNTFTANSSSNVTANITVPTKTSDLINDSNYIASTNLGTAAYKSTSDFGINGYLKDQNLNVITTPGFYNAGGRNTVTNKPDNFDAFGLLVMHEADGSYYTQIAIQGNNGDAMYIRHCNLDTWTAWSAIKLTDTTYSAATQSAAGLMSKDDKTKLDGIAAGANKYTLPVAGTALGGVKSGTDITVDAKGNVSINDNSHAHTIANITNLQTSLDNKLNTSLKGVANGLAELDADGKVPAAQLPSYVDDVLEYDKKDSFPTTGESGKIYVDKTTNLTYRWSGSAYTEISSSLALGETSSTAYRGDRGKTAYDHSQKKGSGTVSDTNPHGLTPADIGAAAASSLGSYLPLAGGTMTGNIGIPSAKSTIDGSVPFAGSTIVLSESNGIKDLANYKTVLGSATIKNTWYNILSVRHRNGTGDGGGYGMYLKSALTAGGSLAWGKQTGATAWQDERWILDSANYNDYAPKKDGTGATGTWNIGAKYLKNYYTDRIKDANLAIIGDGTIKNFLSTSSMTSNKPGSDGFITHYEWDNNGGYSAQLFLDCRGNGIQFRGMESGTWSDWHSVLSNHNYSSYVVPKTGGTFTGSVTMNNTLISAKTTSTHLAGNKGAAIINSTASGDSYNMLFKMNSTNGYWTGGSYGTVFNLYYTSKDIVEANRNSYSKVLTLLNESGNSIFPGQIKANSLEITATTDATSFDQGSIHTLGGIGASKSIKANGVMATNSYFVANQYIKSNSGLFNMSDKATMSYNATAEAIEFNFI